MSEGNLWPHPPNLVCEVLLPIPPLSQHAGINIKLVRAFCPDRNQNVRPKCVMSAHWLQLPEE